MTPYERVIAERMQGEAAGIPLPPRERWVPASRRGGIAPAVVAVTLVLAVATLSALGRAATDVPGRALDAVRSLLAVPARTVPSDWNVFVAEGLLLAVPPEFGAPQEGTVTIFGGAGAPTLLSSLEFERGLSILVWKGTVRTLLDEHWLRAEQLPYTRRPLSPPLKGEEVLTTSVGQSDPVGGRPSGTDESRSLFIQLTPDTVAHVFLGSTSAAAPGTTTTISAPDRTKQDQIGALVRALPDAETSIERAEVERVLSSVIQQLHNAELPPGNSDLTQIFAGEQWVYNWPNSSNNFAYVVIYPDRTRREQDQQERLVDWISPVVQRGVGNVLVLVGSDDANFRYRVISALDELAR